MLKDGHVVCEAVHTVGLRKKEGRWDPSGIGCHSVASAAEVNSTASIGRRSDEYWKSPRTSDLSHSSGWGCAANRSDSNPTVVRKQANAARARVARIRMNSGVR